MKKILIMGLPGSGKTTLAKRLCPLLQAVHFNADDVRQNVNINLGFSHSDRIEQARRMGWLCDQVVKTGHFAVADIVCPTPETRRAFGPAFTVYIRGKASKYPDTNALFVPPTDPDYSIETQDAELHASAIAAAVSGGFEWDKPAALFVGRYQPFHDGHKALVEAGISRIGQACVAVRRMPRSDKNPFSFEQIRERIQGMMSEYIGRLAIIAAPNVAAIFYGRDVGYVVERITLPDHIELISATKLRESAGIGLPLPTGRPELDCPSSASFGWTTSTLLPKPS